MRRLITAFATSGIVSAAALPLNEWVQLGACGILGFLLYIQIQKSYATIDRMTIAQENRAVKFSDNLNDLKETIVDGNESLRQIIADSQTEANHILKQAVNLQSPGK